MTPSEILEAFRTKGIRKVKVGGFDIDGVLRGKYVSVDKFESAMKSGFGFCDVIFGWDLHDVLYDNVKVTGWDSGYPDTHATVDLSTFRVLPNEPDTAAFLVDFVTKEGAAHPACPRGLLKKVLADAKALGYSATFAAELEFFVFKETPESIREKGYKKLTPLSPGMFGYSWLRTAENKAFCESLWNESLAFDIPIEGLHTETGPGVYEVALRYDEALRMADKAALFKTQAKEIAYRHGLVPTFMAKWNEKLPGSSGHLHQSLWSAGANGEKANVFYGAGSEGSLSDVARSYLAGQIALMPELTALYAPHRERVQTLRSRGVGAAHGHVGPREPHLRHPRHRGRRVGDEARVPPDRGRHEPLRRDRHVPRGGPLRHPARAHGPRAFTGRRLGHPRSTPRPPAEPPRRDRAPRGEPSRTRRARRGLRRSLRSDPRVGGAPVRARRHRLGARALLRDHLMAAKKTTKKARRATRACASRWTRGARSSSTSACSSSRRPTTTR
jgi:glutamine synthetase